MSQLSPPRGAGDADLQVIPAALKRTELFERLAVLGKYV